MTFKQWAIAKGKLLVKPATEGELDALVVGLTSEFALFVIFLLSAAS